MSVLTVTATVDASNTPPRVRLDIADTGSPSFASATVTRQDPNGSTVLVRTSDGGPLPMSSNTGLLFDYEAPFGQAVTYSTVETPANVTVPVTVPVTDVWLVDPAIPAQSVKVALRPGTLIEETMEAQQGFYWPMGRSTPVVISSGPRKSSQATLVATTQTVSDLVAIRALLTSGGILLLQVPPSLNLGFDTSYIAVGDAKITRWTDTAIDANRDITMPFTVVSRPAGGSQAQRTLASLLVYPTLASLQSTYPTLGAVLAGP